MCAKEQLSDLFPVLIVIVVMWHGILRARSNRERALDARVRDLLLGTLRPPGMPPMSFTGHWFVLQVTAATDVTRRDIARLLRALERRNVLRRLPAARKRSLRDRFELTPEAAEEMRKSMDAGSA